MKHSYPEGNRVLSLLVLESAVPRDVERRGWDEEDRSEEDRLTWGR